MVERFNALLPVSRHQCVGHADPEIQLTPSRANSPYKPTAPGDLMTKVDDVFYYANDVSQPDT